MDVPTTTPPTVQHGTSKSLTKRMIGVTTESDSVFDKEAEFKKFQANYEPSGELADKAKRDEAALKNASTLLQSAANTMSNKVIALQKVTAEASRMFDNLYTIEQGITSSLAAIKEENETMRDWWNGQFENVQQLMLMLTAMGFEIQLPNDKD